MTAVRLGRGTSLNERQLLLVSVTVESAPVKWAREFPRPPRSGANQLHQRLDYRVTLKPVKIHLGGVGGCLIRVVADVAGGRAGERAVCATGCGAIGSSL